MRSLLILSLLFSAQVGAVEVMSSACGNTYDEALTTAKVSAVDKVNGAWIHGDSYVRDNLFKETITQYNGGVIKTYEVLKQDSMCVIIKADVVPRSNKVETNSTEINTGTIIHLKSKLDDKDSLGKATKAIDSREKAIAFIADKTEFVALDRKDTGLRISGTLQFKEKWKSDYADLKKLAGSVNLESFKSDPQFELIGYDHGKEVYRTAFSYEGEMNLYEVNRDRVKVNLRSSEDVVLKFRVPTDKLEKMNKLEVRVL